MRYYQSTSGPFLEKPYYSQKDIERLCETELRNAGYFPNHPEPIRIERFIEKRFNVTPGFENLPVGVLGYTTFGKSGVTSICISSALAETESKIAERQANSTLAHEAGHGLLHTHLFAFTSEGLALFDGNSDVSSTKILCREPKGKPAKGNYDGCWWEYQANMVIGPLLMPRSLVLKAVRPYLRKQGNLGIEDLDPMGRDEAARHLAEIFEVNPMVAKIRLNKMFSIKDGQMAM